MRTEAKNIEKLITKNKTIELMEGQHFAETSKTYEIWGNQGKSLIQRIAIIRKSSVQWVIEK